MKSIKSINLIHSYTTRVVKYATVYVRKNAIYIEYVCSTAMKISNQLYYKYTYIMYIL